MSLLPYYRWYPADAETDERYAALSDPELGFFHRCLNRAWLNNGLPSDPKALAATMKVTDRYLSKVWPKVSQCFEEADGRLRNPRQEKERIYATSKSERATSSVRKRYERSTKDLLRAYGSVYESESSSSENSKEKQKPVTRAKAELYNRFADFLEAWKQADASGRTFPVKDVDLGCQVWQSLVDSGAIHQGNIEQVFAGLERYRQSQQWRNPQYVSSVPGFLGWSKNGTPNAPKWNDYPAQAVESEY